MRNFTLIVLAAFLAATTSFAQANQRNQRHPAKGTVIGPAQTQLAGLKSNRANTKQLRAEQRSLQRQHTALNKKSVRRAAGITFDETPEGTVRENLVASFQGIAYSWFSGFYDSSSDASAATIVEGTDGNLYIKGLTPVLYDDDYYWIKAEKGEGENEYIVHKQLAGVYYYSDGSTEDDYISRLVWDDDEEYYVEVADTDLKFTYVDGVLTLAEDYEYGIVYEDEGAWEWEGSLYWNFKAEPLTEEYAVLPEGAVAEDFILQHSEGGQKVQLAIVGDKVYVQSYSTVPGWYVGTISGDKVTFQNGQFLGFDSYYESYQWFVTATTEEVWDDEYEEYYTAATITDNIVFDYDAEAKTLTAPENTGMFINGAKDRIYYAERYLNPKFFIFTEVPAVPADPQITTFWDYDEDYESAELDFNLIATDVDGNYINTEKLSYQVYVDDEVFVFEQDEYEDLDADYDELPYGFGDGYWIGKSFLCLFFQPAKNVGLQSIYRGAGVENRSNIVVYDIASGEVSTGISAVSTPAVKAVSSESYYDAAGRKVAAGAQGFVIKTVTFADGSKKSYKVVRK